MASLVDFLRVELAPFPGRSEAVIHFAVCIPLVMLISFFLQVPFLQLAIIVLFFTIMENTLYSFVACALVICGTLLVAVINNLFLGLTIDYPLIRVLISGLMVFFGMYYFRVGGLIGNVGYMWSICIIFLQSNMAELPSGELMLRLNLWSSMVCLYAAALSCLVCVLIRPFFPSRQLREEIAARACAIARLPQDIIDGEISRSIPSEAVQRGIVRMRGLLEQACMESKEIKRDKNRYLALIDAMERLYGAAAELSRIEPGAPGQAREKYGDADLQKRTGALRGLSRACLEFAAAQERNIPFRLRSGGLALPDIPSGPSQAALSAMRDGLEELSAMADKEYPPFEGGKIPFLVSDAFTNPVYVRFALKTVMATLACLLFYKSTQWEGIHTCMLTCIVVAQPGLGATLRKSLLRVSGCLVGSLLALLASIFLIPHMQDVTWYILLCLVVLLPAAWVAVGSPRSNYAGVQIAFAYALALMAESGPTVDLTEIRDRFIGIMVGVVVSTMIHTQIWPEKEEVSP